MTSYSFMLKRELQSPHEDAEGKKLTRKNLATDEDIRDLLGKINGQEFLWVVLMIITGRRAVDISRMKFEKVTLYSGKVGVMIPKDKSSSRPVSFEFEWEEFDVDDCNITEMKLKFEKSCIEARGYVIQPENSGKNRQQCLTIMKQRIARKSNFNLHALRSRRAVICLMKGRSESLVKSKIGWRSEEMVRYYTILSADQICQFKSYLSFCEYLLEQVTEK